MADMDLSTEAIRNALEEQTFVHPTIPDTTVPNGWDYDGTVFGFRVIETELLPTELPPTSDTGPDFGCIHHSDLDEDA